MAIGSLMRVARTVRVPLVRWTTSGESDDATVLARPSSGADADWENAGPLANSIPMPQTTHRRTASVNVTALQAP
ncbi:MAG TPA: hypothetical protein VFS23_29970, partial [Vicinamibacterales bacterium]|nr:hypothetical protein [Vicinamibacterales bacterium]